MDFIPRLGHASSSGCCSERLPWLSAPSRSKAVSERRADRQEVAASSHSRRHGRNDQAGLRRVVGISTVAAQKELIPLAIISVLLPIAVA